MREFQGHDLAGYLDYHYPACKDKKEFQLRGSNNQYPDREHPLSETEIKMEEITRSYAGKIAFNNKRHKEKFIQVLILLLGLKTPGPKGELLFHPCTATDLASILRQIEDNHDKKANTLKGHVTQAGHDLLRNDPKVKKLEEALLNFFYH